MGTLLGFDFGPRKIGVAVGQTISATATPLATVTNRGQKPDWTRIEAIIRDFAATVPDARAELGAAVHYVTTRRAGFGAARDVSELLLRARGAWDRVLAEGGLP